MKRAILSGGSGTLLLGLMLCWPVGAAEMGGRVTVTEVDLVPVVVVCGLSGSPGSFRSTQKPDRLNDPDRRTVRTDLMNKQSEVTR